MSIHRSLLFFFLLFVTGLSAQEINGRVVSDGEPLMGAAVYLVSQPTGGTFTDPDGTFVLTVDAARLPDTLLVEFL
ncbi:MAG: hypothetical protein AAFZ52_17025, partial [Bacteroidota bacterium]